MTLKENIKRHFIYLICLQILSCSNNNNLKNMDSTSLKIEKAPFDFRNSKTIRRDINIIGDQLKNGLGYDHCWVLNDQIQRFRFVASAYEPNSGRLLETYSDETGIQFYSGNFLVGTLPSKRGGNYNFRTGFCFENQHFPDSPNQKNFPTVELNPSEKYFSKTLFKFSVR